jgi:hypothetical protein
MIHVKSISMKDLRHLSESIDEYIKLFQFPSL